MHSAQPYAVYWSIYTDQRGRQQFRKLYWNRLKDLIGRPSKLVGIVREEQWPSGRLARELRCHVWRHFQARSDADAIVETLRAACRVAPEWRVLNPPRATKECTQCFSMIWTRRIAHSDSITLPFPLLNDIMITVHRDSGFRIRPGYQVIGGGEKERPGVIPVLCEPPERRSYTVTWRMQVQTSTKRGLMETHWPQVRAWFGNGAEMIDLEKRSGDVGPFKFAVRQEIVGLTESEAVMRMLSLSSGLTVSVTTAADGSLAKLGGRRDQETGATYSIMAFTASRVGAT